MKQERGARASLRAVPAKAPTDAEASGDNGFTQPRRKAKGRGSRFISDVIVELGFLTQERVDAAVEEARAGGAHP